MGVVVVTVLVMMLLLLLLPALVINFKSLTFLMSIRRPPLSTLIPNPHDIPPPCYRQTHPDGTYLIRESTYFPGDYTLCLLFENKVEHYHILCKESRLTIDEEVFFENLSQLVRVGRWS